MQGERDNLVENRCQEWILPSSISRGQSKARTIGETGLRKRVAVLETILLRNCVGRDFLFITQLVRYEQKLY